MGSTPKCIQMPGHRLEKLQDGKLATIQKLASQHYLIWINGTPVTEVRCVPEGSGRWYWRGGLSLNWTKTRATAIMAGRARMFRNQKIDGRRLEPWSEKALDAIDAARKQGANHD